MKAVCFRVEADTRNPFPLESLDQAIELVRRRNEKLFGLSRMAGALIADTWRELSLANSLEKEFRVRTGVLYVSDKDFHRFNGWQFG